MAVAMILAPAATLLVFVLAAAGIHWLAQDAGVVARSRLAVFAPSRRAGQVAAGGGSLLMGQRQFSDIRSLHLLLQWKQAGARMTDSLSRAGLSIRAGEYLLIRCVVATLAAGAVWLATGTAVLCAVAAAAGYLAPAGYVLWRQQLRTRQFEDQLVDALVLVANALKSGFSFLQAMQAVADEMPDPIGAEFRMALIETRMGGAVDEALVKIADRVRSADFELVVSAMVIQRQVGGNLTEVIGNVVRTVRERHRIQRDVRTLTGEQRIEGAVLGILPLALLVVLMLIQPTYISQMWAEGAGRLMLGVGFLTDVMGLIVIRKLVHIEV